MLSLTSPLHDVPGVGQVLARRFAQLELVTVNDLLLHVPYRYDDFSKLLPIAELKVGERVTVRGRVDMVSSRRTFRRRLTITEALISDGTGTLKAVWFNQPYLAQHLRTGSMVLLAGVLTASSYGLQLEHPTWELEERGGIHTNRLVPLYPLTANLTQRHLRTIIARVLPLTRQIPEWLPGEVLRAGGLMGLSQAIEVLHFPRSTAELRQARQRVTFDELLLMHLKSRLARRTAAARPAPQVPFAPETKDFVARLPWPLTVDQKVAAWEIIKNLSKNQPMLRLLQGDVGSGKTIVAGLAALNATAAGWQTVFLAPTEILARQHYETLTKLFTGWQVRIGLLSRGHHEVAGAGKPTTPTKLKAMARTGELDIIVGTHALLQTSVGFARLGLAVVDEQHRFGVTQRQVLVSATGSPTPHLLSLSATPIPRSLALTLFGNLDLSTLRTLPAGRKPITTRIVPPAERAAAYQLIRHEVAQGHRAFIVCPRIDESDTGGARAVTTEHERLKRDVFPNIPLGLLHGRMNSRDKTAAMRTFQSGTTPILVSTSVVEVGVDVPEATVIAIETAEHFGLAQLHQLRGRVGRSHRQSHCLLMVETAEGGGNQRLNALVRYSSGFELAEFDLKTRGPGDLLGEAQSGFLKLRFAELADSRLLGLVRRMADHLLSQDPDLHKFPTIQTKLGDITIHPE